MKSEPALSLAFTCSFCGYVSQWTRNTEAPYCLNCRCSYCAGLMAFQTLENGMGHKYCPTCIQEGNDVPDEAVN